MSNKKINNLLKNGQKKNEQTSLQRKYKQAHKHIKRCLSLVIREMKIESVMRNHSISSRMAVIKRKEMENNKCCWECG